MSEDREEARVCSFPAFSGDGYGYGGGAVLVIGETAIPFGEGHKARLLAEEIADAWNFTLKEPSNE